MKVTARALFVCAPDTQDIKSKTFSEALKEEQLLLTGVRYKYTSTYCYYCCTVFRRNFNITILKQNKPVNFQGCWSKLCS